MTSKPKRRQYIVVAKQLAPNVLTTDDSFWTPMGLADSGELYSMGHDDWRSITQFTLAEAKKQVAFLKRLDEELEIDDWDYRIIRLEPEGGE